MIKGQVKTNIEEEIVIRTVKNCPKSYDDTKRVLLIDSDSIIYTSVYNPNRYLKNVVDEETGNLVRISMTNEEINNISQEEKNADLEECKFRFRNTIQEICNTIEAFYNIEKIILCCSGKNNFRYLLYKDYKANRKTTLPFLKELRQYIIDELEAFPAPYGEADDSLYHFWKMYNKNVIIATIDKDIKSSCYGIFYNYKKYENISGEFYKVTKEESKYNLCTQIITGDTGDNVNLCPKKGIKYAEKVLILGSTNYQYKKVLLKTYIEAWKGNNKLAKENLKLCYKLLKLHTFEEIKKLNLVE